MSTFVCNACGAKHKKWIGKCPSCNEWNTISEEEVRIVASGMQIDKFLKGDHIKNAEIIPLSLSDVIQLPRIQTNIGELDLVLGGGFVHGGTILIAGEPGIGKSTLLLQIADTVSELGKDVLYVSGEESSSQITMRAKRIGLKCRNIKLCATGSILELISGIGENIPDVMIVDSIQTMFVRILDSNPGTVSQIRASTLEIMEFCKNHNIVLIIVGHVTKDGAIAGPKLLEHMVDTVIYFEGEDKTQLRILRVMKNRFGGVNEIGIFAMSSTGKLEEVPNPSSIFLSDRVGRSHGVIIFIATEGTRQVVTEIESLSVQSYLPSPRRNVVGWDGNRMSMIIAIMQNAYKYSLHNRDIYLSIAGGFKTGESAADLSVIVSIILSYNGYSLKDDIVAIGEVSLSGQVRRVAWIDRRVQEGVKLGYKNFIIPVCDSDMLNAKGINIRCVSHILDIIPVIEKFKKS